MREQKPNPTRPRTSEEERQELARLLGELLADSWVRQQTGGDQQESRLSGAVRMSRIPQLPKERKGTCRNGVLGVERVDGRETH
jgi:hypothetical protein